MKKPTYDLSSSKAQYRAESPKSGNLSTIPKRSLNDDVAQWVAQWVANGGVVVTVTDRMKHAPVVMNQRQRKLLKKDR